jgi:hypothetical protein
LPRLFWPMRNSEASDPPDKNISPWRMARLRSVVAGAGALA